MYLYFPKLEILIGSENKLAYLNNINEFDKVQGENHDFNEWNFLNNEDGTFWLQFRTGRIQRLIKLPTLIPTYYDIDSWFCSAGLTNHLSRNANVDETNFARFVNIHNRFVINFGTKKYCIKPDLDYLYSTHSLKWKTFDENNLAETEDCQVCLTTEWPNNEHYFLK
jgi:hypothetical protein